MSLSRSPSPIPGGGWATQGLTVESTGRRARSPARRGYTGVNGDVTWASAQARSAHVKAFSPQNQGLVKRCLGKLSSVLLSDGNKRPQVTKGKVTAAGRGWPANSNNTLAQLLCHVGRLLWRMKARARLLILVILLVALFYVTPLHRVYRRTSFLGGGEKFVIILAANQGGGVMEWKGPREWAIERESVKNKRQYAKKWGYHLEIVDMTTKKKYAHEWRESWEKVDVMRNTMRKYPQAEWFWWLDLNTYIMEPTRSLQKHIFNDIKRHTYRDINYYNPKNITHPPSDKFLDADSTSPVGDGDPDSIHFMFSQDCGGFNLGSFFMRRGIWTDRLMDIWWDPVMYEQKHMQWEQKEQDALESTYRNQPQIRQHIAFLPQRMINSFPLAACQPTTKDDVPGETQEERNKRLVFIENVHYNQRDRDFVVNMAGCEWGRDCWGEIYNHRQLSLFLNRNIFQKIRDGIVDIFKKIF